MVNTVTVLPPIGILSLSAGALWDPLIGTLGIMLGSFLGTSATFYISRKLGRDFVQNKLKGKGEEFKSRLNKNDFKVILLIRLIPVLPWEFVNYVSGLSDIKYIRYIAGTLIGIFPAVLIQVYFSHSTLHFDISDPRIWLAIGAFVFLLGSPSVYLRWKEANASRKI